MLRLLRIAAVISAGVTGLILLGGNHPEEFLVPDLAVIALLLLGAALPRPDWAQVCLLGGFGFAAGVFTVAFASFVVDDDLNLRVGAAVVVSVVATIGAAALLLRRSSS